MLVSFPSVPQWKLGVWLALLFAGTAFAQRDPASGFSRPEPDLEDPPSVITAVSQSGQFVVTGARQEKRRPIENRPATSGDNLRELTPQTLAVSCERVKAEVLRSLDLTDQWRARGGRTGKIFVSIEDTLRLDAQLAVQAKAFEEGWHFRARVPTRVTEERLVRTLCQAIAMELSSRNGNQRAGEPPLWVVEALTQSVIASSPDGIILQPQTRIVASLRVGERYAAVRARLARQAPLSFHELSQPDLSRMSATDWDHFAACSHLCLHEMQRLPEGNARLTRWLMGLQKNWNWQTGFLDAFSPHFHSLLDVEKWWALAVANFTGRNPEHAWPAEFALRKLDEALQPVGVLPGAGNRASRLSLEDVVANWDYPRQIPVLRRFLQQLNAILVNAPAEVSPLVYQYSDTIESYLANRAKAGYAPIGRGQAIPSVKLLARETVGRLRELDGERSRLTAAPPPQPPKK
ncbi:MAG: hypothetical protein IT581_07550 [Verrucomicrobiales bacterium]|nr:hypothetical protein [Verrucomicrobiales bacterium]